MKKILLIAGALILASGITAYASPKTEGASAEAGAAVLNLDADEIPVVDPIEGVSAYTNSSCEAVTSVEGLDGFTGSVLAIYNSGSAVGVTLDFSELQIPSEDILSMDIRYNANVKGALRMTTSAKGSYWYLNETIPAANQWITKTFLADGTGFATGYDFTDMTNSDGNFSYFNLAVRSAQYFYIDYIQIVYASEESNETYKYEPSKLPIDDSISGVGVYTNTSKTVVDASEAPEGGSGEVEKVVGSGNVGVTFDFSDLFKVDDIISIKFRVYCECTNEFRIIADTSNWITRHSLASEGSKWISVVLDIEGQNFVSGKSFANLKDADGNLRPFNVCLRSGATLYIDYIEIETVAGAIRPAIQNIINALHMDENVEGQCNSLYEDARELVLGLNEDLLNEFLTLDRYQNARERYEAWSLAKGVSPYSDIAHGNNFGLDKSNNTYLFVSVIASLMVALAAVIIIRKKTQKSK